MLLNIWVDAYGRDGSVINVREPRENACDHSIYGVTSGTPEMARAELMGGNTHYCQVQGQQWIQRKQPRTQGYSLRHGSAQSAWQGIIWSGENYRD